MNKWNVMLENMAEKITEHQIIY
jgi:hypothetical protein